MSRRTAAAMVKELLYLAILTCCVSGLGIEVLTSVARVGAC